MRREFLLGGAACAMVLAAGRAAAALRVPDPVRIPYPERPEVREFLDRVAQQEGLDRARLDEIAGAARFSVAVRRLNALPAPRGGARPQAPDWPAFRARHVDADRVRAGRQFAGAYRSALQRAEARFGTPSPVIVSILGIETRYGRLTGTFRAIDVLMTLAFDDARRAARFRDELADYLVLCEQQHWDPLAVRSSHSGAIGWPQFLPSSLRRLAIDFDGDGIVDLQSNPVDAIGSVANFLSSYGWRAELPVLLPLQPGTARDTPLSALRSRGIDADRTWSDLADAGARFATPPAAPLEAATPVLLVELPAGSRQAPEYRVGTVNFSALLQYNRSYFYAAAVSELADQLTRLDAGAPQRADT